MSIAIDGLVKVLGLSRTSSVNAFGVLMSAGFKTDITSKIVTPLSALIAGLPTVTAIGNIKTVVDNVFTNLGLLPNIQTIVANLPTISSVLNISNIVSGLPILSSIISALPSIDLVTAVRDLVLSRPTVMEFIQVLNPAVSNGILFFATDLATKESLAPLRASIAEGVLKTVVALFEDEQYGRKVLQTLLIMLDIVRNGSRNWTVTRLLPEEE